MKLLLNSIFPMGLFLVTTLAANTTFAADRTVVTTDGARRYCYDGYTHYTTKDGGHKCYKRGDAWRKMQRSRADWNTGGDGRLYCSTGYHFKKDSRGGYKCYSNDKFTIYHELARKEELADLERRPPKDGHRRYCREGYKFYKTKDNGFKCYKSGSGYKAMVRKGQPMAGDGRRYCAGGYSIFKTSDNGYKCRKKGYFYHELMSQDNISGREFPYISTNVKKSLCYGVEKYVEFKKGNRPLILSIPHGGDKSRRGLPARVNGTKTNDSWTKSIGLNLYNKYLKGKLNGGSPYVVANNMDRMYVDMNRSSGVGTEHSLALEVHHCYHNLIAYSINEIQATYNFGLLVDLHGQSRHPSDIYLGTKSDRTMNDLNARHGSVVAYEGDKSFRSLFVAENYSTPAAELPALNGSYIVDEYGTPLGFDAIQFEVHSNIRNTEAERKKLSRSLSKVIRKFYLSYIQPPVVTRTFE